MPLPGRKTLRSGRRDSVALVVLSAGALIGLASAAPAAVQISSKPTQNMTCSGGVCSPSATTAVLNVSDLKNLLASGNLTVTTTGAGGVQANDIVVKAALSWSNGSALYLDSHESIAIAKSVSVKGQAGIALTTNDGGSGGTLSFGKSGNITFANLSSKLSINGTSYVLVNTIKLLASDIAANPSGSYAFASGYDASQDGTYTAAPVPTTLTGTVEGLGNTISNLAIDCEGRHHGNFGLFAEVGKGGSAASVRLTSFDIRVASVHNNKFGDQIGGLVGANAGTLSDDHVTGKLWTRAGAGGLVGQNDEGLITLSSADVHVGGPGGGGGLVWLNFDGNIEESFATGPVKGENKSSVGGLVGTNGGEIFDSYATGSVTGGSGADVGGFAGLDSGLRIGSSYSTGLVAGGTESFVGGFAGFEESSEGNEDCYWDTTTSGTDQGTGNNNGSGITGLTTQQLQSGLPAGFDPSIWAENPNINGDLPYLINNPPKK